LRVAIIFPRDSEALFNTDSRRTFGGANVQLYIIARELGRRGGDEIFSLIPEYAKINFPESGLFRLVTTFRESSPGWRKMLSFFGVILRLKPDVIIQRGLTLPSCILALYCRLMGSKFVFMFAHDIEAEGRYQMSGRRCPLFPLLLRCSHRLIVQNEIERDLLAGRVDAGRLAILKKGLVLGEGEPSRAKKNYDCIWIARCERWKNPEEYIRLARLNPGRRFLMICAMEPVEEEYFDSVRKEAEKCRNIEFLEFATNSEVYSYLAMSRVFVITSGSEGDWPMVVLEALSLGVPVVSLHVNYSGLLSGDGAGWFAAGDAVSLNEGIVRIVSDGKLAERMSHRALEYIREHHDIGRNAEKLLDMIR
jgi:glycosyltransferase involved in cell wall biosynthesis